MIKLDVMWVGKDGEKYQEKSFKDEYAALEWCRKNYNHIMQINGHTFWCERASHFDLMYAIGDRG